MTYDELLNQVKDQNLNTRIPDLSDLMNPAIVDVVPETHPAAQAQPFAKTAADLEAQKKSAGAELDELLAQYKLAKQEAETVDFEMREIKGKMQEHLGIFGEKYQSSAGSIAWRAGSITRSVNTDALETICNTLEPSMPALAAQIRATITRKQGNPVLTVAPAK